MTDVFDDWDNMIDVPEPHRSAMNQMADEIERLRAENERLRDALHLAVEWGIDSKMSGNPVSRELRLWVDRGMPGPPAHTAANTADAETDQTDATP